MNFVTIYSRTGTAKISIPNHTGATITEYKREQAEMSSDTITMTVRSKAAIEFIPGDYISVDGAIFRINQMPQVEKSGVANYITYNLVFESAKYDLTNVIFLLPNSTLDDYLTGDFETILAQIVVNANRVYANQWAYTINYDSSLSKVCTIQFTEMNCMAALQKLCEEYEVDYRITESNGVKTITNIFEGSISGVRVSYGHAGGLYRVTRQAVSSENVVTKCFVYGSSENLPSGYPHSRLCLPYTGSSANPNRRNESYLTNQTAVNRFGVKEGILILDDVKPSAKFQVSEVTDTAEFVCDVGFDIFSKWAHADYPEWLYLRGYTGLENQELLDYFDSDVVGTNKYNVCGTPTVTFDTGNLAGRSFEILSYNSTTNVFKIKTVTENADDDLLEQTFPDDDTFCISDGDDFIISNILMPQSIVEDAEDALESDAEIEFAKLYSPTAVYEVEFDPLANINKSLLVIGNYIRVIDSDIGIDKQIKIARLTEDYLTGELNVELSDLKKMRKGAVSNTDIATLAPDAIGDRDTTNLTCRFTANYNGNKDKLHVTAGKFTNRSILGREKSWVLYERTIDLTSRDKYDIYVRVYKTTSYAEIVMSGEQDDELHAVMEFHAASKGEKMLTLQTPAVDDWSELFKVGYITQPRLVGTTQVRSIVLDYGTATVSAGDINAGSILDSNGVSVMDVRSGVLGNGAKVSVGGSNVALPDRMSRHANNEGTTDTNMDNLQTFANNVITAVSKLQSLIEYNMRQNVGKYDQKDMEEKDIPSKTFNINPPDITDLDLS